MAFRIQKDANLDSLQANNLISSSLNKPMIYLNSQGNVDNQSYIGPVGTSLNAIDTEIIVPVRGSFTRLFVHKAGGDPSDSSFFTIFVNDTPITDTETVTGATVSAELQFLGPTTINYAAGDRIAVRITITSGTDPSLALTLF